MSRPIEPKAAHDAAVKALHAAEENLEAVQARMAEASDELTTVRAELARMDEAAAAYLQADRIALKTRLQALEAEVTALSSKGVHDAEATVRKHEIEVIQSQLEYHRNEFKRRVWLLLATPLMDSLNAVVESNEGLQLTKAKTPTSKDFLAVITDPNSSYFPLRWDPKSNRFERKPL